MKQPNLSHLKIDRGAMKKIRTALSKKNRVTITANLDTESLKVLQTLSKKSGIRYQRLLNTVLTSTLTQQESIQSRLDRLEQELRKIKRHVAA
jgi:predicted DNA binding CopG/RHH family protein